jgi:hypothetical protein
MPNQRISRLKAVYRAAFCDPHHRLYPKLIEVRNVSEMPPPLLGSYLEIEEMAGARVRQVGRFGSLQQWQDFPFKGAGGVGLEPGKEHEIHSIATLSRTEFEKGRVWWVLLDFIY